MQYGCRMHALVIPHDQPGHEVWRLHVHELLGYGAVSFCSAVMTWAMVSRAPLRRLA
jgi:hypothetical protein